MAAHVMSFRHVNHCYQQSLCLSLPAPAADSDTEVYKMSVKWLCLDYQRWGPDRWSILLFPIPAFAVIVDALIPTRPSFQLILGAISLGQYNFSMTNH